MRLRSALAMLAFPLVVNNAQCTLPDQGRYRPVFGDARNMTVPVYIVNESFESPAAWTGRARTPFSVRISVSFSRQGDSRSTIEHFNDDGPGKLTAELSGIVQSSRDIVLVTDVTATAGSCFFGFSRLYNFVQVTGYVLHAAE